MKKKREHLLQDLVTDWLWMHEDEMGRGLLGHHGYMGNVVAWKINDNGVCEHASFCDLHLVKLATMLAPYHYNVWQNGEFLYFEDMEENET